MYKNELKEMNENPDGEMNKKIDSIIENAKKKEEYEKKEFGVKEEKKEEEKKKEEVKEEEKKEEEKKEEEKKEEEKKEEEKKKSDGFVYRHKELISGGLIGTGVLTIVASAVTIFWNEVKTGCNFVAEKAVELKNKIVKAVK